MGKRDQLLELNFQGEHSMDMLFQLRTVLIFEQFYLFQSLVKGLEHVSLNIADFVTVNGESRDLIINQLVKRADSRL